MLIVRESGLAPLLAALGIVAVACGDRAVGAGADGEPGVGADAAAGVGADVAAGAGAGAEAGAGAGGGADAGAGPGAAIGGPLDGVLRFNHVQALGTHNSYHLETAGLPVPQWAYSHLPLDEQITELGVRQFELDLNFDRRAGVYRVFHVGIIDAQTTCALLTDCLEALRRGSDAWPLHHPLLVLLEVKSGYAPDEAQARFEDLEAAVAGVWPEERLVTPDLVRGEADDLRSALAARGWPTLGELRGRALFVLHEGGDMREAYTRGGQSAAGRLLFPDAYGNTSLPYAAYHSLNDPVGSGDRIRAVVDAGHLVRTRSDAGSEEPLAGDTARRDAALASGAHFISTDYPAPRPGVDYVVRIPGGTPSRCNPRAAPAECTSEAIEDPAWGEPGR